LFFNIWIIDSGASDHITPHLNLLSSVQKLSNPGFITMPNGKQSSIEHVGTVQLSPTLVLTNVLHVLDFEFNLLSVSKLCSQIDGQMIFTSSECILQGPTLQAVVLGRAGAGLYHVQHTTTGDTTSRSLVMQSESQHVFGQNFHFSELES